jgi:hypothetical protein
MSEEIFIKDEKITKPKPKKKRKLTEAQLEALAKGRKSMAEKRQKAKMVENEIKEKNKKDKVAVEENKKRVKEEKKKKKSVISKEEYDRETFTKLKQQNKKLQNINDYTTVKNTYLNSGKNDFEKKFLSKALNDYTENIDWLNYSKTHLNSYIVDKYEDLVNTKTSNLKLEVIPEKNHENHEKHEKHEKHENLIINEDIANKQKERQSNIQIDNYKLRKQLAEQNEMIQKKDKSLLYFERLQKEKDDSKRKEEQYLYEKKQKQAIKIHNNYIDNGIFVNERFGGQKIKPKYKVNRFN